MGAIATFHQAMARFHSLSVLTTLIYSKNSVSSIWSWVSNSLVHLRHKLQDMVTISPLKTRKMINPGGNKEKLMLQESIIS